tara:strand:+ start:848 stop:1156 length:309 start_codon:yes stop_codon:yes gene_type:complete
MTTKIQIKFSTFEKDGNGVLCKEIIRNGVVIGYIEKRKTWRRIYDYDLCTYETWTRISTHSTLKDAEKRAKEIFYNENEYKKALELCFQERMDRILRNTKFV